jgi:hypothetical protein
MMNNGKEDHVMYHNTNLKVERWMNCLIQMQTARFQVLKMKHVKTILMSKLVSVISFYTTKKSVCLIINDCRSRILYTIHIFIPFLFLLHQTSDGVTGTTVPGTGISNNDSKEVSRLTRQAWITTTT